jgi:hypothetical protein
VFTVVDEEPVDRLEMDLEEESPSTRDELINVMMVG